MLPEGIQPRTGHTVTSFNLSPGVVEVTVFGGYPKWIPEKHNRLQPPKAATTMIRLGE